MTSTGSHLSEQDSNKFTTPAGSHLVEGNTKGILTLTGSLLVEKEFKQNYDPGEVASLFSFERSTTAPFIIEITTFIRKYRYYKSKALKAKKCESHR
ncbi:MAG: hypothetical protein ACI83I_002627 [Bacteroidia bacterium]|jgi:hypothetical protein